MACVLLTWARMHELVQGVAMLLEVTVSVAGHVVAA
jgi:hypothetical protein